ncbi:MAG: alpha/beta fold hydrolase [Candidatus Accumulibacter sp.]|jgi:pimeloyl-[acyl-carrier protein] methyl ester esterase|nr:alpha/beta fold hydrolase [Accumulibacter sp.]
MPPSSIPANVALIHGWGFNPSVWETLAKPLSQTCNVQCLALPGYAGETPESSTLPVLFDSIGFEETTRQLSRKIPEGALLCGWSLGGMIAIRAAIAFPSRFSGLVLIATSPCFLRKPGWDCAQPPKLLESFATAVEKNAPETLSRFNALLNQGDVHARDAMRSLARAQNPTPKTASLLRGLEWLRETDLRAEIASLEIPILLIHGEKDPLIPIEAAWWMQKHLRNARLEIIPGAAHAPFVEHSATIARWIDNDTHAFKLSQETHPRVV